MNTYLLLLVGVLCAGGGGELFVRGTVGLARAARISPGIIATTVAAFATSSPELTVGINAALNGTPRVSLGDALGSNLVNVALILGLALLIAPIKAPRGSIRRDFPVALLAPVGLGALLLDGQLSRIDGIILLGVFMTWLGAVTVEARSERSAVGKVLGEPKPVSALVQGLVGLVLLIVAGRLIVYGATGIATTYGLSELVIGATVVAVGTSVPELATAIISRLRGHDEISLGTILGSNIFNGLFIIGVVSSIGPVVVGFREVTAALVLGLVSVAITYPRPSGVIGRWRGGMLLALYAIYLAATLQA